MLGSILLWGFFGWLVYACVAHAGSRMKDEPKNWWDI